MVIAVLGEKGGTGKTTFAVNLAGIRACQGYRVLLVDADRQGSSTFWVENRRTRSGELALPDTLAQYGNLASMLGRVSAYYDDIVLDVGAGDTDEMRSALLVADLAITPVKPAGMDMWTMGLVNDLVGAALGQNPQLECFAALNMASPNPKSRDTVEALAALGHLDNIKTAPAIIRQRVAYSRASTLGLTAAELKPLQRKAVDEFTHIYDLAFTGAGINSN